MDEIIQNSIFKWIDPRAYKIVGFDTETHLITEKEPVPKMVCITFSEPPYIYGGTFESKLEGARRLISFLVDDSVIIVGHNVFYDISVVIRFFMEFNPDYELDLHKFFWKKIREGKIRDTEVTGKLIAIRKDWLRFDPKMGGPAEFSLAALVKRYLDIIMEGKEGEDVWRKRYSELDGIPLEKWEKAAIDYPINDAILAKDLYVHMLTKYTTSPDEVFQVESAWVLHKMGVWGIATDADKAKQLEDKISPIIKNCQTELIKEGYLRPPEYTLRRDLLKKAILEELGEHAPKTKGGDVSLTSKVFGLCKNKFIEEYLLYKDKIDTIRALGKALEEEPIENKERVKELIQAYIAYQKNMEYPLSIGLVVEEEPTQNKEKVREAIIEHFRVKLASGAYNYENIPLTDAADKLTQEEMQEALLDINKLKKMVATDRETVLQVPCLEKLAEMGEFYKIKTTYIPIFKQGNILHPHWNPLVASGRVSVSNPNLNNMPREHGVRECFKARPGYVYVTADYSQAELCSLSQICTDLFGYSKMGEAIKEGKDLHLLLASQILDIPYDEALARHKEGDKVIKDARQMAKAANFGYPGGLGPDKFVAYAWTSYKVKITRQQAIDLKQIWLETYPEVSEFFAYVSNKLGRKNWNDRESSKFDVTQHRSGRVRGKVGFCDGLNTFFQGLTADGAKYSKNTISYEMYCNPKSPLYGSRIVAFIYDEILMECPEEKAHDAAIELTRLMLSGMRIFLPDIPSKVEMEMMRRWIKNAKAVYKNDRLVPFDDAA